MEDCTFGENIMGKISKNRLNLEKYLSSSKRYKLVEKMDLR